MTHIIHDCTGLEYNRMFGSKVHALEHISFSRIMIVFVDTSVNAGAEEQCQNLAPSFGVRLISACAGLPSPNGNVTQRCKNNTYRERVVK
jgi:hypothetical protein